MNKLDVIVHGIVIAAMIYGIYGAVKLLIVVSQFF
jgi:hypothetical protein